MFVAKSLQARPAGLGLAIATVLMLCTLAGCKKEQAAATADTAATPAASQATAPPAQAVSAQVAAMGADQLREAASAALKEQRLYAPAAASWWGETTVHPRASASRRRHGSATARTRSTEPTRGSNATAMRPSSSPG